MKLAVMQPYLFPYFGYFQLMAAVDAFVVYDDVTFIKQGWINRNRLKIGGAARYFTVPVADISSNRLIRDVQVAAKEYPQWRAKFLKSVRQNYGKAPFFSTVYSLLENVFSENPGTIADLARSSLSATLDYLGVATRLVSTSAVYSNRTLQRSQRLLDICQREGATVYYNSPGGATLYSKDDFATAGITLKFLKPRTLTYTQAGSEPFLSNLSALDLLMNVPRAQACAWLSEFDLA